MSGSFTEFTGWGFQIQSAPGRDERQRCAKEERRTWAYGLPQDPAITEAGNLRPPSTVVPTPNALAKERGRRLMIVVH